MFKKFVAIFFSHILNTYDVVFDAHASPASAHSASSASRLEYDGVGTDELFDL